MTRRICERALEMIKELEGLELYAYPDPGTGGEPFTIGYGHTGDVRPGEFITEEVANYLLDRDLKVFEDGVETLLPGLSDDHFCALVSFSYNVGLSALADSTLLRRIKEGDDPGTVIAEELPRWVIGGDGAQLAGLVTRRQREVAHALGSDRPEKAPFWEGLANDIATLMKRASRGPEISLVDAFTYYEGLPHQRQAVELLEDAIAEAGLLDYDAPWVVLFRSGSSEKPAQKSSSVQLSVPYLYQLDSEVSDRSGRSQGPRMCFSSTNAMLVEGLEPGTLRGHGQADDAYLQRVLSKFGDTTSSEAQVAALRSYGIDAHFRTDGTSTIAKNLLRSGIPVPIGVLHHGPVRSPRGGGHWLLLVGFDETAKEWICHDPAGRMDIKRGGYADSSPTAGRFVRYPYQDLAARWMPAGEGDGWFIEVEVDQ